MTQQEADDLARRVIACPRWRWMPGMHDDGGCIVVQTSPVMRAIDEEGEPCVLSRHALPDLSDPATLGCLLALYDETRTVLIVPDPVYTMAAAYGLHHPMTIAAIVSALEARKAPRERERSDPEEARRLAREETARALAKQANHHVYREVTYDRDDRPIPPTCAHCGRAKDLCTGDKP
jgi:hypothetical protein